MPKTPPEMLELPRSDACVKAALAPDSDAMEQTIQRQMRGIQSGIATILHRKGYPIAADDVLLAKNWLYSSKDGIYPHYDILLGKGFAWVPALQALEPVFKQSTHCFVYYPKAEEQDEANHSGLPREQMYFFLRCLHTTSPVITDGIALQKERIVLLERMQQAIAEELAKTPTSRRQKHPRITDFGENDGLKR